MTSSESESRPRPRKRAKLSAGEDGGLSVKTKSRGRPRKDTDDATAADRRRTQIRLAQRAYRQRKETTISLLQEQSSHLRSIINQMNEALQRFNDVATQARLADLNQHLGQELERTTASFAALAKAASAKDDQEEDCSSPDAASIDHASEWCDATSAAGDSRKSNKATSNRLLPRRVATNQERAGNTHSQNQQISLDLNATENGSESPYPSTQAITRWWRANNSTSVGQIFDQPNPITVSAADADILPFGLVDTAPDLSFLPQPYTYPVVLPTPDFTPPRTRLTSPIMSKLNSHTKWTYSLDEVTFARRLRRRSLETGLYILSSPNVRRAKLEYVFRLSLPFMTLEQIRDHFRKVLQGGIHDSLEMEGIPFKHVGGAGTHYPNKAWNSWTIGPLPPQSSCANNNAVSYSGDGLNRSAGIDPSSILDMTGFEGEWFDCGDVEGYLEQEKGCRIDPQCSFAECLIDIEEEASSPESDNQALVHGAGDGNAPSGMGCSSTECSPQSSLGIDVSTMDLLGTDPVSGQHSFNGVDISAMPGQPFTEATPQFTVDAWNTMPAPPAVPFFEPSLPVIRQKQKKVGWVDVSKLIEELVRHGMCLGGTPGFRRWDVDKAFNSALISAF